MSVQLRVVKGGAGDPTVWPLFAELARRHDVSREEAIIYGVIVALTRMGREATAYTIRDALGTGKVRRSRSGPLPYDLRDLKLRLSHLVRASLIARTSRVNETGRSMPSLYSPLGPR